MTQTPTSLHTISIRGMHCQACVSRIDAALRKVSGVTDALVTLSPARSKVWSDGPTSETALVRAVESAGSYTVTDITSEALAPTPQPHDPLHAPHHATHQTPLHTDPPATQLPTPEYAPAAEPDTRPALVRLYPLFLIVAFITLVAGLATAFRTGSTSEAVASHATSLHWSWHSFMLDFMAGFFLVFAFFKLLDLRGFASSYAMYDLLAMRIRPWGLVYPFVELALGVMFLVRFQIPAANIATLALMLLGAAGVLNALRQKKQLRCACLGTALNLPMTTVTLVEDLAMAAMAGAMLLWPASA
jgi:copper chaperone CopZ